MVRVRFAPSPTGSLHLGSALTAAINRRFADENDAVFVLRIDDTDAERTDAEAEAGAVRFGRITLLRPDGRPTYHLASVVDDVDFGITHVIRGNDHLSNQALHQDLT